MSNLSYFLVFLLALCLVACTQDPVVASLAEQEPNTIDTESLLAAAEAEVQSALEEIKADQAAAPKGPAVYVPTYSSDELADALAAAGPNGRVVLESGPHYESETVVIDQRVRLEGEPGAVLYSTAAAADQITLPRPVLPVLHVKGGDRSRLINLDIRPNPDMGAGNTGILIEDARDVRVYNSNIEGFTRGVVLFGADHAKVVYTTITGSPLVELDATNGIFVFAGEYVRLFNNDVSGFGSNFFLSDSKGMASGNYTHDGETGMLVCTAPAAYVSPDEEIMQAPISSNQWLIFGNDAQNNSGVGYGIIDGAFNNRVFQNKALGNGLPDVVLFNAISGAGFFLPAAVDNHVISTAFPDVTIMDCGDNNTINGGIEVDCFL